MKNLNEIQRKFEEPILTMNNERNILIFEIEYDSINSKYIPVKIKENNKIIYFEFYNEKGLKLYYSFDNSLKNLILIDLSFIFKNPWKYIFHHKKEDQILLLNLLIEFDLKKNPYEKIELCLRNSLFFNTILNTFNNLQNNEKNESKI